MKIYADDILAMKAAVDALMALDLYQTNPLDIHRAQMKAVSAEVKLKRIFNEMSDIEVEVLP